MGFHGGLDGKEICLQCRRAGVQSLGQEEPLEKEMATHSSILAWEIPWTEEPGGLQSIGSQRVRHNWETNTFAFKLSEEIAAENRTLEYMITHKPMGEMCGLPSEYWTCSEVREPSRNSNTSYLNSKCIWAKTVLKKHLLQRLLHVIKLTHIPGKLFLASEQSFPIGLPI